MNAAGADTLLRHLGAELRAARKRQGRTRRDVVCRVPSAISEHSLAAYEQGGRPLSVLRLVELSEALEVPAVDLLARALDLVAVPRVDLRALARDERAELSPLRRWAQVRVCGESPVVRLDAPALAGMAELCGLSVPDLLSALPNGARS